MTEEDALFEKAQPIRNHGLFSKAEKALTIAGWSERARRDIEIFPLKDVEGLTPILMVLADDGSLEGGGRGPPPPRVSRVAFRPSAEERLAAYRPRHR